MLKILQQVRMLLLEAVKNLFGTVKISQNFKYRIVPEKFENSAFVII